MNSAWDVFIQHIQSMYPESERIVQPQCRSSISEITQADEDAWNRRR